MKLINQSGPECLITSLAMVLDLPEVPKSSFKDPVHLHIQEVQDYLWTTHRIGLVFVDYDPYGSKCDNPKIPSVRTTYQLFPSETVRRNRIMTYLKDRRAILIYEHRNIVHACAWDGRKVYNPIGRIEDIDYPKLREAWVLI